MIQNNFFFVEDEFDIENCGYFIAPSENWLHMDRTMEKYYCFVYTIKGDFNLMIDDVTYHVKEREFILMKPRVRHFGISPTLGETEYFWFHISLKESDFFDFEEDKACIPLHFKPKHFDRLIVSLNQLIDMYSSKYYTSNIFKSIIRTIIYETSNQYINQQNGTTYDKNFEKLLRWLDLYYYKQFTLEQLGEQFNYSRNYLATKFKLLTGTTLVEYLNLKRIESAKSMLCNSHETVKQIAFAVGFTDEKYFMRVFKEKVHMTPTEFRNSNEKHKFNAY